MLSIALLRSLPLPPGVPVVGDTHNVEFDVLRRTGHLSDSVLRRAHARCQWRATRREEGWCARHLDLLLATSARDRTVFETELGVRRVAVIPNGIDPREFGPSRVQPEPGTVLFSGLMNYSPNEQAVRWFLDAVFPLVLGRVPGARLIVAGAAPPAWLAARASDRVEVTGRVPDMRPYLERAAVAVAPLRIGGGTRVKILEAQAVGRPVVSTPLGAEGLDLRHGESVLLADTAEAFAACVADALTRGDLASRLAMNGRQHVLRHYNWDRIGETLHEVLDAAVALTVRQRGRRGSLRAVPEQAAS